MRFIVPAIPHTITNADFTACAFTQKVRKFIKMMSGRGHEIYHLGHELSDIHPGADVEHIDVTNNTILRDCYGTDYVDNEAWREQGFGKFFTADDSAHRVFSANVQKVLPTLKTADSMVVSFWGWGHKGISDCADAINMPFIEAGIGYPSAFARWRIYESHAIMNAMYGAKSLATCDMNWYHRVIPNYFDAADFTYDTIKHDYILYLGRIGGNKGVDIAIDATRRAGKRLLIAGQGSLADLGYTNPADPLIDHVKCVGYADVERRRFLLSKASAVIIASKYLEPFAGVQVEAWLSGTPVISPDWAAFAELNQHGVTGYRCNNFRDFVEACLLLHRIRPLDCYSHAREFLFDRIAPRYEAYFQDVLDVYQGAGWYTGVEKYNK